MKKPTARGTGPQIIVRRDMAGNPAAFARGALYLEDTGSPELNAIAARVAMKQAKTSKEVFRFF